MEREGDKEPPLTSRSDDNERSRFAALAPSAKPFSLISLSS